MALLNRLSLPLALLLIAELALGGCSGGSSTLSPAPSSPASTATPVASATPTAAATATPTGAATATPTPVATATPTPVATATPTPKPSATPTSSPTATAPPSMAAASKAPAAPTFTVPPSPDFTPPALSTAAPDIAFGRQDSGLRRDADHASCVAPFFNGATAYANDEFYLTFPNGNYFGYYYAGAYPYVYHYDLGYEYVVDANDGKDGVYLYDFASGHYWYTSPTFPFPYIYDYTLKTVLYYYPQPNAAGRYSSNPRYFYDFATSTIISMVRHAGSRTLSSRSASTAAPVITSFSPASGPVGTTVVINGSNFVPPLSITFAGNAAASGSFTSTKITVTVPSGAETGEITVAAAGGSVTTASDFTVGSCP